MAPLTQDKIGITAISPDTPFALSDHQTVVCTFLKSGLSQKAFCKQYSLKASTFKNWVYRYRKNLLDQMLDTHEAIVSHKRFGVESSALFVPVHVTHDESQDIPPIPEQPSSSAVKSSHPSPPPLRLEIGHCSITIPVGYDKDTLCSVISIMQACL